MTIPARMTVIRIAGKHPDGAVVDDAAPGRQLATDLRPIRDGAAIAVMAEATARALRADGVAVVPVQPPPQYVLALAGWPSTLCGEAEAADVSAELEALTDPGGLARIMICWRGPGHGR